MGNILKVFVSNQSPLFEVRSTLSNFLKSFDFTVWFETFVLVLRPYGAYFWMRSELCFRSHVDGRMGEFRKEIFLQKNEVPGVFFLQSYTCSFFLSTVKSHFGSKTGPNEILTVAGNKNGSLKIFPEKCRAYNFVSRFRKHFSCEKEKNWRNYTLEFFLILRIVSFMRFLLEIHYVFGLGE